VSEYVNCLLDGGILVLDKEVLTNWESSDPTDPFYPPGLFSIALDVKGKTDQVYDWPNEDWTSVWRRETQELVSIVLRGDAAILVLHEGVFCVDLGIDQPVPASRDYFTFSSRLQLRSGVLAIAELSTLIQDWGLKHPPDYDTFVYRELSVVPGWHTVSFLVPKNVSVTGEKHSYSFGTQELPAVYVRLDMERVIPDPIKELFHVNLEPT
jgi:hypothetical protein